MLKVKILTEDDITLANVVSHGIAADGIEFGLSDGATTVLNKVELFDAFNLITSQSFYVLCVRINAREEAIAASKDAFDSFARGESDSLDALTECYRRLGRIEGIVENVRDSIIDSVGYYTWDIACALYDSLTGIPREWLN